MGLRSGPVIALYAVVLAATLAVAATVPRAGRPVLVAAAPWRDAADLGRIVGAAGGTLVDGTALPFAVVARSADADFVAALYRAGALAVLDAGSVGGCLSNDRRSTSWNSRGSEPSMPEG